MTDLRVTELPEELLDAAVGLWQQAGLTRPWNDPLEDCRRALTGEESTVLAALDAAGELAGTVMVGQDGHRGWIYYLAVDQRHQDQGLGKALLAGAEDWLRGRGVPKLMLMVRQENAGVQDFYRALGYTDQDTVVLGRWLDTELD
ncbi:GNAT family acetyltransferase [Nesterenkonia sp. LB17]|uniref:GNAT family acetyltransferase n=1 Tax=unclassified Nesterenkonia TaxID=2629769 RepID=UPI001F4C8379|nr:GNAT family acetyltransferase [Nesterenkonia sp. DZ6]MCH8561926.1 GNAT family acetyltransferase [Nesterenkonia sp. YGD6]MCH8564537.1 GNAT family acetyltransferase [Nesterenkonia sp. LB17]